MIQNDERKTMPPTEEIEMDGDFRHLERGASASLGAGIARTTSIPAERVPAFDVRRMVGDGTTAHMVLDGQTYCLRITRSGKLILTK